MLFESHAASSSGASIFPCMEAPSSPRTCHKERCVLSHTRALICQCVSYVFRSVMGSWLHVLPVRRLFYLYPPTPKAQHSTSMITTQHTVKTHVNCTQRMWVKPEEKWDVFELCFKPLEETTFFAGSVVAEDKHLILENSVSDQKTNPSWS